MKYALSIICLLALMSLVGALSTTGATAAPALDHSRSEYLIPGPPPDHSYSKPDDYD